MVELVQYFVLCCGCHAKITMEMFRGETTEVIRSLTENFAEDSGEYPLIATGPSQKKFKVQSLHTPGVGKFHEFSLLIAGILWVIYNTDSGAMSEQHCV